jgi:hypothetical protein
MSRSGEEVNLVKSGVKSNHEEREWWVDFDCFPLALAMKA